MEKARDQRKGSQITEKCLKRRTLCVQVRESRVMCPST